MALKDPYANSPESNDTPARKTVLVIGGGAAGFFCAVNAARMNPGLRVILLEKSGKLLSKVKVSGGGRCNLTHDCQDIVQMSRAYPRGGNFVKKAFHYFFTHDIINWFEKRGVSTKAEKDGRVFPRSDSSQTIIDCLLREAQLNGVDILLHHEVDAIQKTGDQFEVRCTNGKQFGADSLCIACGGYPRSSMFDWLKHTGHTIEEPVPSLFTFNLPGHPIRSLMGVSVASARVKLAGTKSEQEGPLLITHWGISGPAVLKLSAWGARDLHDRQYEFQVLVSWLPDYHEESLRNFFKEYRPGHASQKISGKNPFLLPARLWEFITNQSGISPDMRWADLPAAIQQSLIRNLLAYSCQVKGKTTFKEEFVTAGGIRLSEVDVNSMMSKKIPGLFFAGEVLDVDGITGGYNFQHAWTSAWIAATAISKNGKSGTGLPV